MDEKGFLIGVLQKQKRVFNRQLFEKGKLLGTAQDGNREWITILGCICADGSYLPPGIIYQATTGNLQDTWLDDFHPEEQTAYFASSSSGWTSEDLGYSWLTTLFDRYTKEKARKGRDWRLLYVDGHNSHLNMRFVNYCEAHRILLMVFLPHVTHRL